MRNKLLSFGKKEKLDDGKAKPRKLKTGDTFRFGEWDGKPIEWIVLDVKGSKALLLSKQALLKKKYNNDFEPVTWQDCTLRYWLNGEFYRNAFTDDDRRSIMLTKVYNDDNTEYNTNGGAKTADKVFLLSIKEYRKYFKEGCNTKKYKRCRNVSRKRVLWWLRSPGNFGGDVANVSREGSLYRLGINVNSVAGWARPALYYNLQSSI